MSDLFDEVSKMLSEAEELTMDKKDAPAPKASSENELDDIMSEIENLEKEFAKENAEAEKVVNIPAIDEALESLIVDGVLHVANESKLERMAHVKDTLQELIDAELANANVVPIKSEVKPSAPIQTQTQAQAQAQATSSSPMKMSVDGTMSLDLSFSYQGTQARVSIDPVKGISVDFRGVTLTIDETNGCTMSMENGTKLSIPLTTSESKAKKIA